MRLAAIVCSALCATALAVAAPASAASSPWELTSLHAPTSVPVKAGVNQVMTVTFHANVGKFLLEFSNEQTGEEGETKYLPFDATAKEVLDALVKLRSGEPKTAIGPGNVVVNGGYDAATETGTYAIEFTGLLGDRYLGEGVLSVSGEITSHEEEKFEKEKKAGGTREPEEPEGEAEIADARLSRHGRLPADPGQPRRGADRLVPRTPPHDPREAAGRAHDGGNAAGRDPVRGTQRRRMDLQGARGRPVRKRTPPARRRKARQGTETPRRRRPERSRMHAHRPGPPRTGGLQTRQRRRCRSKPTSTRRRCREPRASRSRPTSKAAAWNPAKSPKPLPLSSQAASFGVQSFTARTTGSDGQTYTRRVGARTPPPRACSSTPTCARAPKASPNRRS